MEIKSITYERVLSLGNYENKKLSLFAEVEEGDDVEESISRVMETVERKIREEICDQYEANIRRLKQELRELQQQVTAAKSPQPEDNGIPDSF
ncbi:hypothetical protein NIES21_27350 [Anabaenopsis circularis NIES-21]|uniref:Uncharacterized protein n=1 Tax=Anabaenopsis circularis NIES-21 TaxID=1085406 RepID=A0A1Z4GHB0_9CYAN|nr:hypothetical protein NIES21_27350 [Anabaenopsis circularis NIES-21]